MLLTSKKLFVSKAKNLKCSLLRFCVINKKYDISKYTKYETLNFLKNNPSKLTERQAARIRIDTTEKARSTYWNSIPF